MEEGPVQRVLFVQAGAKVGEERGLERVWTLHPECTHAIMQRRNGGLQGGICVAEDHLLDHQVIAAHNH